MPTWWVTAALSALMMWARLRTLRSTLIDPAINEQHGGRIVNTGVTPYSSCSTAWTERCAVRRSNRKSVSGRRRSAIVHGDMIGYSPPGSDDVGTHLNVSRLG